VSTGRRELGADKLFRTQYPQAADVGVFSVHVVCEDDDLKDVGMHSFAGAGARVERCRWSGVGGPLTILLHHREPQKICRR